MNVIDKILGRCFDGSVSGALMFIVGGTVFCIGVAVAIIVVALIPLGIVK